MNFIFDIGNVLVDYDPLAYLERLFVDKALIDKLNSNIFQSPDWLQMDHGFLSRDEATRIFIERMPEFESEVIRTMDGINDIFIPLSEVIDLLPIIKAAGHSLYYLSNMQKEIRDFLVSNHKYLELFDGGIFSCDVNVIKPSPKIYHHLLDKYQLDSKDCLFFDDMPVNVTAAEKEGIKGILFTTAECVLPYIKI